MKKISSFDDMLCFQVYALHHAFGREYQSAFAGSGFTYPKYLVLKALHEADSLSLSELAQRLGLESNTLSPLVKKMASFGVIERLRNTDDERRITLRNSAYGEALLAAADAAVTELMAALDIAPDELAQTIELLTKVRVALETVKQPSFSMPAAPLGAKR